jgi:hypothetical protein
MFNLNSDIHNINTRQKLSFHQHSSNLSPHQKGVHSFGIKVFDNLPRSLKKLTGNSKQFKTALKRSLLTHSFYSIDEYSETLMHRFLRGWKTKTMNTGKRYLRETIKNSR